MIYFHMDDNEEGSAYEAGIRNRDVILELNARLLEVHFYDTKKLSWHSLVMNLPTK